jgi:hypothetical protein
LICVCAKEHSILLVPTPGLNYRVRHTSMSTKIGLYDCFNRVISRSIDNAYANGLRVLFSKYVRTDKTQW